MKNWVFVFSLLFIVSCNPKVVNYLNPKAKFENFSSYQLVNVKIGKRKLPPEATQLLAAIESEIKLEMEKKRNYQLSNIRPDLILRYELVSNTRTETNDRSTALNPYRQISFATIYESVILIELLEDNKLVWQGSYDMNQSRKDARNQKTIKKAIGLIFTTYPYMAGKADLDPSLNSKKKK